MIALLITVLGSLTLIGSVAYLIVKNVNTNNDNKSLNPSEPHKMLEYREDPDALRCRIDPMKDVYFINVKDFNHINRLSELSWIDRYGNMTGTQGRWNDIRTSGYIVSNDKDDLKEMISDILKERIMNPSYPESIRIDFVLPDEFVCYRELCYTEPDDIIRLNPSEVAEVQCIIVSPTVRSLKVKTYDQMNLYTWLETYDEYMDKQVARNRKKEEDRLNGILNQLSNVNKL